MFEMISADEARDEMLMRSATTSPSEEQLTGRVPYRATGPPALPKP